MGGDHTWDNVQCACRDCNIKKGNKLGDGASNHANPATSRTAPVVPATDREMKFLTVGDFR